MIKQEINMVGGGFQHDICSSAGNTPESIIWVKGNHTAPISIHLDSAIYKIKPNKSKLNFAWLHESRAILPHNYNWVSNNIDYIENNFELLFTHDMRLVKLSDKIVFLKWKGKPWVKQYGIHPKSKLVSMIASNKVMCPHHRFRQQMIKELSGKVDHFGRGFKEITRKEEGLNDYYFSVAMENHTYLNSYSEKITDCFATGTIPIYHGTPGIGDIFNSDCIIKLDEHFKVENLSSELYYSKMNAVKENFEIVKNMPVAEDYIYNEFIK